MLSSAEVPGPGTRRRRYTRWSSSSKAKSGVSKGRKDINRVGNLLVVTLPLPEVVLIIFQ
jgi:hypothetical protein